MDTTFQSPHNNTTENEAERACRALGYAVAAIEEHADYLPLMFYNRFGDLWMDLVTDSRVMSNPAALRIVAPLVFRLLSEEPDEPAAAPPAEAEQSGAQAHSAGVEYERVEASYARTAAKATAFVAAFNETVALAQCILLADEHPEELIEVLETNLAQHAAQAAQQPQMADAAA